MIQLCDRRAACLLLQYTCGLISSTSTSISTLPSQAAAPVDISLVLSTQLLSLPSLQLSPQHQQNQPLENTAATTTTVTTNELARFIATNTPKEFLWAVKQSGGKFLYRGEEPNSNAATSLFWIQNQKKHGKSNDDDDPHFLVVRTCNPAPDLLLPETYGYDPLALRYFEELEAFLSSSSSSSSSFSATPNANVDIAATPQSSTKIIAKPSNGHIATSDALEAGKWGKIVSIWPLLPSTTESSINPNNINNNSATFSYVWPRDRSVFYESSSSNNSDNDTSTTTKTIQNNSLLVVNEKLQDALTAKGGREVLFAFAPSSTTIAATASAAFLAIPGELDVALRDELERIDYGL